MNIYTEDEALIELLEEGCTNDKRYKRLPKDVIKGYIKAYNSSKSSHKNRRFIQNRKSAL